MKKVDVKNLISAIGREKKAYFFSDAEHTYLSNGYFVFKTCDHDMAQYIIDSVNDRKRKPEWTEMERLRDIVEDRPVAFLCTDIQTGRTANDGTELLILKQEYYSVWINAKLAFPKTNFYTTGPLGPVYQFVGRLDWPEAILMILPIYHR